MPASPGPTSSGGRRCVSVGVEISWWVEAVRAPVRSAARTCAGSRRRVHRVHESVDTVGRLLAYQIRELGTAKQVRHRRRGPSPTARPSAPRPRSPGTRPPWPAGRRSRRPHRPVHRQHGGLDVGQTCRRVSRCHAECSKVRKSWPNSSRPDQLGHVVHLLGTVVDEQFARAGTASGACAVIRSEDDGPGHELRPNSGPFLRGAVDGRTRTLAPDRGTEYPSPLYAPLSRAVQGAFRHVRPSPRMGDRSCGQVATGVGWVVPGCQSSPSTVTAAGPSPRTSLLCKH